VSADRVYETDPDAAPDSAFVPAELGHLVPGARLRLRDDRRTPLRVLGVDLPRGLVALEVGAFEDAGARWELPVEDVARLQAPRDAPRAPPAQVGALREAVARLDRPLRVPAPAAARAATLARVARERAALRPVLDAAGVPARLDVADAVERRTGPPELVALADALVARRGLTELDRAFCEELVRQGAGEEVKAHAIVLAELGLCPYKGKVLRDPALLEGRRSRARRAEHLVLRMGLAQELWARTGRPTVTLLRAATADGELPPPPRGSFVSATCSRAVAEDHFAGGPTTRVAVLLRQEVALERVVLSFLETAAMNARFREAEVLLVGAPRTRSF